VKQTNVSEQFHPFPHAEKHQKEIAVKAYRARAGHLPDEQVDDEHEVGSINIEVSPTSDGV